MALSDEDLDEYVERSSKLIDESPQMNEQNTCRKIIDPLINLLGWDTLSSEVLFEYSIQMGTGTKQADYALAIEETPVVFIEAKGCDTNIKTPHIDQLKSYMRQVGVEWGVMSNGKTFEIFRRDFSSNTPNEISLGKFPIERLNQNRELLRAISRNSIERGESRQIAEKIQSRRKATQTLQNNKEEIAEEVTQVIVSKVGEGVSQAVETEAKSFIDDLSSALTTQTVPSSAEPTSPNPATDASQKYSIQIMEGSSMLEQLAGDTQAETFANLTNYLIRNHDLLEQIEIPYIPGRGTGDRALINTKPRHPDGSEMKLSKQLENGYFLFTSLNAESKIRYISELAEIVEIECNFSESWK